MLSIVRRGVYHARSFPLAFALDHRDDTASCDQQQWQDFGFTQRNAQMQTTSTSESVVDWGPLAAELARIPETMRVSIFARDLEGGSTLEHDADRAMTAASTIKTLILVAVARAIDAGSVTLDTPVTVTDTMRIGGSGVLNWLHDGITLPVEDLAWLMIAISDNSASNALIEVAGLDKIQHLAHEIDVPTLHLARPFLGRAPADGQNRNQVTARGLTDLLTAIWNDTAASPERCAWMRKLHGDQQHTDRLARDLSDGVLYAGKTGTLKGVSHDCGVITGPSGTIVISVLVESDATSYDDDAFIGSLGQAVAEMVSNER